MAEAVGTGADAGRAQSWEDSVRDATARVLASAGRQHLATTGASFLRRHDTLSNRARSAARRAATVGEWVSMLLRGLKVPAPDNSTSSAVRALSLAVDQRVDEWLDLVGREIGYLIAVVQVDEEEARSASPGQRRRLKSTAGPVIGPGADRVGAEPGAGDDDLTEVF